MGGRLYTTAFIASMAVTWAGDLTIIEATYTQPGSWWTPTRQYDVQPTLSALARPGVQDITFTVNDGLITGPPSRTGRRACALWSGPAQLLVRASCNHEAVETYHLPHGALVHFSCSPFYGRETLGAIRKPSSPTEKKLSPTDGKRCCISCYFSLCAELGELGERLDWTDRELEEKLKELDWGSWKERRKLRPELHRLEFELRWLHPARKLEGRRTSSRALTETLQRWQAIYFHWNNELMGRSQQCISKLTDEAVKRDWAGRLKRVNECFKTCNNNILGYLETTQRSQRVATSALTPRR